MSCTRARLLQAARICRALSDLSISLTIYMHGSSSVTIKLHLANKLWSAPSMVVSRSGVDILSWILLDDVLRIRLMGLAAIKPPLSRWDKSFISITEKKTQFHKYNDLSYSSLLHLNKTFEFIFFLNVSYRYENKVSTKSLKSWAYPHAEMPPKLWFGRDDSFISPHGWNDKTR